MHLKRGVPIYYFENGCLTIRIKPWMMGFGELSTAQEAYLEVLSCCFINNSLFLYSPKLNMFWGRFHFPPPQQN